MIRFPRPLFLLTCLALAACAGAPVAEPLILPRNVYGAFVGIAPERESQLAEEAVRQLAQVYPPAETLLDFPQRIADDGFGQKLLWAAQHQGYFIRQSHVPGVPPSCAQKMVPRKDGAAIHHPLPTCYLVDDVDGLLRLTLFVAGEVWSRLYAEDEGGLRPAGAWAHWRSR
ncbi:MAG: hypothetical protein LBE85_13490 [Candidatus Accumulibacter sp.]|jgi:hypothetical protein|nr:hypothetical protein [Accumulibacter sp.]